MTGLPRVEKGTTGPGEMTGVKKKKKRRRARERKREGIARVLPIL